jgi:molybdopterin-binding protein
MKYEFPNTNNLEARFSSFLAQLPKDGDYLDIGQLKKIGEGGSNAIYEYPPNPDFVIRIDKSVLARVVEAGGDELSIEAREKVEQYVAKANQSYSDLYAYFGDGHCIKEHFVLGKISTVENGTVESAISVQERSEVFSNLSKISLDSPYLEKGGQVLKSPDDINKALLADGEFDERRFLEMYESLKPIFDLIEKDEGFSEQVKDFLNKFKLYFTDKGRFIDLMGKDNLLFYKDGNNWNFKLGSVLKVETRENLEEALRILETSPEDLNTDSNRKNNLMNALNLIRMLNAVGLKSGLGKIFDITLSSKQLENLKQVKF